ncbi:MAG: GNAT family N-acetyltransferase [Candidatus Margulisbacteria bacterium]|nr:GNAT family N-acetyltransferase [Candidatus Margulisiibacteriota bacterium]
MIDFSGKNVVLKSLKPTDFDQILKWGQSSEESFFLLNFPPLFNRDDLAREISRKDIEIMSINSKTEKKPLGLIQMGPPRPQEKQIQIRFTVDTFEDYKADTLLEAPTIILDHYFKTMGINKVHAYTLEFEKEYESLLKKLGFKKEGTYNRHFFHKEKYYAINIFGLFKKDFIK